MSCLVVLHMNQDYRLSIYFVRCSTVRCLGVLSGSVLLGMSREELKTVCPEEGGRVFFQLQAVKSSLAVSHTSASFLPTVHRHPAGLNTDDALPI